MTAWRTEEPPVDGMDILAIFKVGDKKQGAIVRLKEGPWNKLVMDGLRGDMLPYSVSDIVKWVPADTLVQLIAGKNE